MAQRAELEAILKFKEEMSAKVALLERSLGGLEKKITKTQSGLGSLENTLRTKLSGSLGGVSSQAGVAGEALARLGPVGLAAGAAIGALAAAAGFSIRNLVSLGEELTRLERETGISAEGLQKLKFAAGQVEIPFQKLTDASTKLERALGQGTPEVVKAVKALGLELNTLRAAEPEKRLLAVVRAMTALKDPTREAAAGAALFGRAWSELRLRPEDLEEFLSAMERAPVVSNEAAAAGERLGDAWDALKENAKALSAEGVAPLVEWLAQVAEDALFAAGRFKEFGEEIFAAGTLANQLLLTGTMGLFGTTRAEAATEAEEKHRKALQDTNSEIEKAIENRRRLQAIEKEQKEKEAQERAKKATEEWNKQLEKAIVNLGEIRFELQAITPMLEIPTLGATRFPDLMADLPGMAPGVGITPRDIPEINSDLKGVVNTTEELEKAQQDYNQALAGAADLAQILGGNLGEIVGQTLGAAAALENLARLGGPGGILGGFGAAFRTGRGESTGILGILAGIGGLATAVGPLVGPLVSAIEALFSIGGRSAETVAEEAGRDLGVSLSEGLAEAIHESGQNIQLFLTEIFAEGRLSIDRFAEEVGDLFSLFERGEISEFALISELEEDIPILIEHLRELGPAGEEQLQRIIAAADRLGISFDGLQELIQGTFAPETMEQIASSFDLTNDQVRELGELLGVEIQTDLERMAASLGLTVEDFNALAAAAEAGFGITAEELPALLEALGVSASDLAESLGVSVSEGAGTATDETAAAAENIGLGADRATIMANELERAARAAGAINVNVGSFGAGVGMQHGGTGETTRPTAFISSESGQREGFAFWPGGLPDGGMNLEPVLRELQLLRRELPTSISKSMRDAIAKLTV